MRRPQPFRRSEIRDGSVIHPQVDWLTGFLAGEFLMRFSQRLYLGWTWFVSEQSLQSEMVQRRHSVTHHFHIIPDLILPQGTHDEEFIIRIVFDQQDEFAVHIFSG